VSEQRQILVAHSCACVSPECRYRDYPDKDYDSLVIALAFLRDASIFGRFLTFRIFRRNQVGFRTKHLQNDIRECCYPGKRMRLDTTRRKPLFRRTRKIENVVSASQTFPFLHPAACASGRFVSCWWGRRKRTSVHVETKQACVSSANSALPR
jgi:hypothetical protein